MWHIFRTIISMIKEIKNKRMKKEIIVGKSWRTELRRSLPTSCRLMDTGFNTSEYHTNIPRLDTDIRMRSFMLTARKGSRIKSSSLRSPLSWRECSGRILPRKRQTMTVYRMQPRSHHAIHYMPYIYISVYKERFFRSLRCQNEFLLAVIFLITWNHLLQPTVYNIVYRSVRYCGFPKKSFLEAARMQIKYTRLNIRDTFAKSSFVPQRDEFARSSCAAV